jgi:histidinol-phosphatase
MKQNFLSVGLHAVREASKIISSYYSQNIQTMIKEDRTPVTVADKESEKCIREVIQKAFPNHGILGEEMADESIQSEYLWIIDPIDGTKNYTPTFQFLRRNWHFGVAMNR